MVSRGKAVSLLISVLLAVSLSPLATFSLESSQTAATAARATTTWAGTMTLTSDYTVAAGDTLIIDAGATISFAENVPDF